ncbi:hypothetical protein BHM03_00003860 [Ensete ventricosum]|nr:hypothetical protein BHM03_00003860 [Ensete ventricosum]
MASYPVGASDCAENSQFLACYRVVPPKLTVGGQLREKSTVGGRLREKKKEEEKKEVPPFPVLSSPSRHRRPRLWAIFLPREETEHLPVQGERLRRLARGVGFGVFTRSLMLTQRKAADRWICGLRFFRHLCMSAKVPAAVRLAKQALAEGKCVVIGLQSTGEARTEEAVTKYQGLELDDFVSGPRELLLKLVEENYPLPPKPDSFPGEESVKELQRKRHSATPGVSFRGRVRKVAKWNVAGDSDSFEESLCE